MREGRYPIQDSPILQALGPPRGGAHTMMHEYIKKERKTITAPFDKF